MPGAIRHYETDLKTAYLVTVALNPEKGVLFLLYQKGGRVVEKDLDTLAYVISHALKSPSIKKVVFDKEVLEGAARRLHEKRRRLIGADRGSGIEAPDIMIKKGGSQRLSFRLRHGALTFLFTRRAVRVRVAVKSIFTFGLGENLVRILNEFLELIEPELRQEKLRDLSYDERDEAGIMRAYTERRGVVASQYVAKEEYGVDARDVSYEFKGYDVEAGDKKIEVKAFRDAGGLKTIVLTENEYEKMCEIEGYEIFVVEDAWDDKPRVNIINSKDLKDLKFDRKERSMRKQSFETTVEVLYECQEDEWRKAAKQRLGEV
jgi:hypothetical protein